MYNLLEIAWRGYTHPSMFAAGGISLTLIYLITVKTAVPFAVKAAIGGLAITAVELAFGIVVNLTLGLNVWDYSGHRYNLLGQICPIATLGWTLLSVPAMGLCRILYSYVFRQ
ncbi:MAG: hypothetical protein IJL71_00140 [Oscillospiraceae bacterium]|nr:hypothetical protein [Oscillospiraceae bacterium]